MIQMGIVIVVGLVIGVLGKMADYANQKRAIKEAIRQDRLRRYVGR